MDKSGWQHHVYQADKCALHIHMYYLRSSNCDRAIDQFATTPQVQKWLLKLSSVAK